MLSVGRDIVIGGGIWWRQPYSVPLYQHLVLHRAHSCRLDGLLRQSIQSAQRVLDDRPPN